MTQQDDINAITTELSDGLARIQAEVANLEAAQAANQPLDLTALRTEADAVAAVVPAPIPAPDPTTDPSAPVTDPPAPPDPTVPVDPTMPSDPTSPPDSSGTGLG